jgi:hypothetical protein
VKSDRLDAAALCQRLDRYERRNKKAFSSVRILPVEEERQRAMSRQEFAFALIPAARSRGIVAGAR